MTLLHCKLYTSSPDVTLSVTHTYAISTKHSWQCEYSKNLVCNAICQMIVLLFVWMGSSSEANICSYSQFLFWVKCTHGQTGKWNLKWANEICRLRMGFLLVVFTIIQNCIAESDFQWNILLCQLPEGDICAIQTHFKPFLEGLCGPLGLLGSSAPGNSLCMLFCFHLHRAKALSCAWVLNFRWASSKLRWKVISKYL